jgi:hypothetical protein
MCQLPAKLSEKLSAFGITEADLAYIQRAEKPTADVLRELLALERNAEELEVLSAATLENGFMDCLTKEEVQAHLATFEEHIRNRTFAFVVPAAGAASRQFQLLRTVLYHDQLHGLTTAEDIAVRAQDIISQIESQRERTADQQATLKVMGEVSQNVVRFWQEGIVLRGYAFVDDLKKVMASVGESYDKAVAAGDVRKVMQYILEEDGLGYGSLPKVLMRYHTYHDASGKVDNRLALEEHLRVGAQLFSGASSIRMHFILSEEHEQYFVEALEEVKRKESFQCCLQQYGFTAAEVQVSWDFQKHATDSVALEVASGKIARDAEGMPLLRKAGHGALLPNLAALDVDGVWLQNVDNVLYGLPQVRSLVVTYKKIMAGLALGFQAEAEQFIAALQSEESSETVDRCFQFMRSKLLIDVPLKELLKNHNASEISALLVRLLDRPLVTAGYVPLAPGQAGGGPFVIQQELEEGVVVSKVNTVEGSEFKDGQSSEVFRGGHFFNPVNLFVLKANGAGQQYDLLEYQDESRCFISSKTDSKGVPIKAYERPGLWNGALAKALQVSIATPSNTFAAVKDCAGKESFLHPLHQPDFQEPLFAELDRERGVVDQELENFLQGLVTSQGEL